MTSASASGLTGEVDKRLGRKGPQDHEFWKTYTQVTNELLEASARRTERLIGESISMPPDKCPMVRGRTNLETALLISDITGAFSPRNTLAMKSGAKTSSTSAGTIPRESRRAYRRAAPVT